MSDTEMNKLVGRDVMVGNKLGRVTDHSYMAEGGKDHSHRFAVRLPDRSIAYLWRDEFYVLPEQREAAPVANRERVAEVLHDSHTDHNWRDAASCRDWCPTAYLRLTDALFSSGVLRDEAEVKAEALREAADAQDADPGFRDPLQLKSAWLRERADKIGGVQ